ncbi:hypothetical protein WQE_10346 [Paraburkholderia hospita]|uniref:Uncharacterized protein n=1 Tax=Paraburkholderia hospita TaxID=169430 RepID=A0ABP2PTN2_9BURK|nr:hypothetical protein [Paraburkholderia hospita]EIN01168.1 hypothetical protein WQE_10346 [Paraburkholderia hospita]
MKDSNEQFEHPEPVKHSDNEKSKMPHRLDSLNKPIKKPREGEPPLE